KNKSKKHEISLSNLPQNGAYYDQKTIWINKEKRTFSIPEEEISLSGTHNMINVMCALKASLITGAGEDLLIKGLSDFKNAAHRMERVEEINGILFINDSKGTNVEATAYALAAVKEPIIWIAGGVDKGNDYSKLYPWINNHVKILICLGKDNEKLKSAFEGRIKNIMETQDIVDAVTLSYKNGEYGDVVLLSPACASFDLFKNYEDRGEQFKSAVKSLVDKE